MPNELDAVPYDPAFTHPPRGLSGYAVVELLEEAHYAPCINSSGHLLWIYDGPNNDFIHYNPATDALTHFDEHDLFPGSDPESVLARNSLELHDISADGKVLGVARWYDPQIQVSRARAFISKKAGLGQWTTQWLSLPAGSGYNDKYPSGKTRFHRDGLALALVRTAAGEEFQTGVQRLSPEEAGIEADIYPEHDWPALPEDWGAYDGERVALETGQTHVYNLQPSMHWADWLSWQSSGHWIVVKTTRQSQFDAVWDAWNGGWFHEETAVLSESAAWTLRVGGAVLSLQTLDLLQTSPTWHHFECTNGLPHPWLGSMREQTDANQQTTTAACLWPANNGQAYAPRPIYASREKYQAGEPLFYVAGVSAEGHALVGNPEADAHGYYAQIWANGESRYFRELVGEETWERYENWYFDGMTDSGAVIASAVRVKNAHGGIIPVSQRTRRALHLLPVELAIDADRDGTVTFGSDSTSTGKPFRFWVNDDHDHGIDTEDLTGDRNCDDGMINGIRDLEDFTVVKMRIGALRQMLTQQSGKIGFRWKDTSGGSPSCRIFTGSPTLVKAKDYLATPEGAETVRAQNNLFGRNTLVSGGSAAWLRSSLLTETSSDEITLLLEGASDGKGKLTLVFELNGQSVDGPSIDVQRLRVGEMYDRGRITVDAPSIPNPWVNVNPPALTWAPDTAAGSPKIDPNAKAKTIIWVHGWRMDYAEYASWGDTSFKRLWQMGFKGRFYAFRWPTFSAENDGLPNMENITPLDLWRDGGLTYNASEYRSWLSGPALANFVNQTANGSSRYMFAHSMGNVISGAAIKSGMNVTKYAMCNAAMASMAYDGVHNDQPDNDFETIDTDTTPHAAAFWGLSNRFNPTGRTTMANFALPMDAALGLWSFNNEWFKPYSAVVWGYGYDRWNPDPNEKLWYGNLGGISFVRYLTTDAEAFGYCVQARTRAAGAKLGVGNMDTTVDMSSFGFGDEHSAEWNRAYQNSYGFWKRMMEEFDEDVSNR